MSKLSFLKKLFVSSAITTVMLTSANAAKMNQNM